MVIVNFRTHTLEHYLIHRLFYEIFCIPGSMLYIKTLFVTVSLILIIKH